VEAVGTPTDALREIAEGDFGVSGWTELFTGSGADLPDNSSLELWANAELIEPAATTNKKTILNLAIGTSASAVPYTSCPLN